MDYTLISEFLNVVLIPSGIALAYKLRKIIPQKREALDTIDILLKNSDAVIAIICNVDALIKHYNEATKDNDLSEKEIKDLIAEIHNLIYDPAVVDLKKLIEAQK